MNIKEKQQTKQLPPREASFDERIEFTRQNGEVGDKCKFMVNGKDIYDGYIVDLTVSRIGGNAFVKIYKQRNKKGDWDSGDKDINSSQFFPIKCYNGGVVLVEGKIEFDVNKAKYLSII